MTHSKGGDLVTEALIRADVEVIFGIISNHTVVLHEALRRDQDKIRYIGGRTELGLGYMADGYARASGRPGVFLTSAGPGASHSIAPLGEAYFACAPVLLVTTNVPKAFVDKQCILTHETINQPRMFESVTDWNSIVFEVDDIPGRFEEAFNRFATRRPRSIELEMPFDVLAESAGSTSFKPQASPPVKTAPRDEDVQAAADILANAKRPLLWVGEELQYAPDVERALISLAETLGAAVITGEGAKGVFPESHPQSLGQAISRGNWGENPTATFAGSCDAVLVLGSCLSHRATVSRGIELSENLVHVTLADDLLNLNYPAKLGIVADCQLFIDALQAALSTRELKPEPNFAGNVKAAKQEAYDSFKSEFPEELRVLEAVRAILPEDTITVWDFCLPLLSAVRCFPVDGARKFMFPHGWMSLGFAFPASLGAKLAEPDVPVVCFTGDGGFQYNMQELATAVQHGIAPIVVIFNNNCWGLLERYQNRLCDGRTYGVELVNPDFVKLAESYGIESERVSTVDGLCQALTKALDSSKIRVIEVSMPDNLGSLK